MEPFAEINRVLGPRDTVVVEGPDAATYLQSQVSQDLDGQEVGQQRWTFVLDPTGKIDALARITRVTQERFELDTDAGFGCELLTRIERFKIRVEATTSLVSAEPDLPDSAIEAARVGAGWPKLGAEIIPGETIPAGVGLSSLAVSFTKGCYPGQELVERMDSRGADAPRSLRRLTVSEGAGAGDPIVVEGDVVGVLTSVAGTTALGWVKRGTDLGAIVEF